MYLNPEIAEILHQKVLAGLYTSEEVAIEKAVELLIQKEDYIRFINNAIEEGERDLFDGNVHSLEAVRKELENEENFSNK
jgi:hypothetical protein